MVEVSLVKMLVPLSIKSAVLFIILLISLSCRSWLLAVASPWWDKQSIILFRAVYTYSHILQSDPYKMFTVNFYPLQYKLELLQLKILWKALRIISIQ